MTQPRAVAAAGAALLLALLTGCSAGLRIDRADGYTLMSGLDSSGMDAQIIGELAATETGCVGLAGEGGDVIPTVWPSGSRLTDSGIVVDGTTIAFGEAVTAGGGEVSALEVDPPPECEGTLYNQLHSLID